MALFTISSLHIGQNSTEAAEVEDVPLLSSAWSNDILELMSCGSVEVDAESTEMELAEGDCRLVVLGGRAAIAGDRFFPLPKILPPPSFRADIVP